MVPPSTTMVSPVVATAAATRNSTVFATSSAAANRPRGACASPSSKALDGQLAPASAASEAFGVAVVLVLLDQQSDRRSGEMVQKLIEQAGCQHRLG